ncbi:MAG: histidine phosphatase family protein [Acidimicrobiales bacterium]
MSSDQLDNRTQLFHRSARAWCVVTLYVVRHGRTTANASGFFSVGLTPSSTTSGENGRRAFGPPCRRNHGLFEPAHPHPASGGHCRRRHDPERLIELDYGDFDLRPLAEITPETWAAWRADPNFRPPNGETLVELATRRRTSR